MKKTSEFLREKKRQGRKISVLTGYDYPTAVALQAAEIDMILVGDSVGRNVLGYASERDVTVADIAHHLRAVRRGASDPFILADLPYGSYDTLTQALESARLLTSDGADGVKLEGASLEIVRHLVAHGIEVSGHLGLEPQHHTEFKVQGKLAADALRIFREAQAVAAEGAFSIVLELIPHELAGLISGQIEIPTIGIGAGAETDGQVLVITDVLGYGSRQFRHNKRYAEFGQEVAAIARRYAQDVLAGHFPAAENTSRMAKEELDALLAMIR